MTRVRRATSDDAPFLEQMLAVAADWRPGVRPRSIREIMGDSALACYVAGWPTERDVGFVAEDGRALGAAWWRFWPNHVHGYGFVDEATPELSIGVVESARGRGVGTLLLQTLIGEAERCAVPALSLSVESDNPAASLYMRLGFEAVGADGGSITMILNLVG